MPAKDKEFKDQDQEQVKPSATGDQNPEVMEALHKALEQIAALEKRVSDSEADKKRIADLEVQLQAAQSAKAVEVKAVNSGESVVLICISRVRTFAVEPAKVLKAYKGTSKQQVLKQTNCIIGPGSIVQVTPELAEFLLSYRKDFQRYDVPLA